MWTSFRKNSGNCILKYKNMKKKIIIITAIGAIILTAGAILLTKQDTKTQNLPTGNLKIEWTGSASRGWFSSPAEDDMPHDFSVSFISSEPEALSNCSLFFDSKEYGVNELRFNTPEVSALGNHYSATVKVIEPQKKYEIGQTSDSRGVDLPVAPKTVKLQCANGFSEWNTGF